METTVEGAASPVEESGGRSSDQDHDGPEHDLPDLPFGDRLLDLLQDPYAGKLLENRGEVLPFRVRSSDVY